VPCQQTLVAARFARGLGSRASAEEQLGHGRQRRAAGNARQDIEREYVDSGQLNSVVLYLARGPGRAEVLLLTHHIAERPAAVT
jgi:hypothetical protein